MIPAMVSADPQEPWLYSVELEWKPDGVLSGRSATGAAIVFGQSADGAPGHNPMEMVLFALGGCTGSDVVNILTRMRVPIRRFLVSVQAERSRSLPKVYKRFHVCYRLWTDREDRERHLARAIQLSLEKYCSVGLMLEKAAPVSHSLEVITGE